MRRRDKLKNMQKVNRLFESRTKKNLLKEYGSEFGSGGEFDNPEEMGQSDFYDNMNNQVEPTIHDLDGYDKIMAYPKPFRQWIYANDTWALDYTIKQGIKSIPELFQFWKREFGTQQPEDARDIR